MRNTIASLLLLVATSATAEQSCPSIEQSERPRFSHPHGGEIVTHFGTKNAGRYNTDIVYAAAAGDAVRAAADGQVSHLQRHGAGERLTLRHAQGFASAYAPMSEIAVVIGDCVRAGAVLGRIGATDVHFELMINGRLVDPERLRGGLPPR